MNRVGVRKEFTENHAGTHRRGVDYMFHFLYKVPQSSGVGVNHKALVWYMHIVSEEWLIMTRYIRCTTDAWSGHIFFPYEYRFQVSRNECDVRGWM